MRLDRRALAIARLSIGPTLRNDGKDTFTAQSLFLLHAPLQPQPQGRLVEISADGGVALSSTGEGRGLNVEDVVHSLQHVSDAALGPSHVKEPLMRNTRPCSRPASAPRTYIFAGSDSVLSAVFRKRTEITQCCSSVTNNITKSRK